MRARPAKAAQSGCGRYGWFQPDREVPTGGFNNQSHTYTPSCQTARLPGHSHRLHLVRTELLRLLLRLAFQIEEESGGASSFLVETIRGAKRGACWFDLRPPVCLVRCEDPREDQGIRVHGGGCKAVLQQKWNNQESQKIDRPLRTGRRQHRSHPHQDRHHLVRHQGRGGAAQK